MSDGIRFHRVNGTPLPDPLLTVSPQGTVRVRSFAGEMVEVTVPAERMVQLRDSKLVGTVEVLAGLVARERAEGTSLWNELTAVNIDLGMTIGIAERLAKELGDTDARAQMIDLLVRIDARRSAAKAASNDLAQACTLLRRAADRLTEAAANVLAAPPDDYQVIDDIGAFLARVQA